MLAGHGRTHGPSKTSVLIPESGHLSLHSKSDSKHGQALEEAVFAGLPE